MSLNEGFEVVRMIALAETMSYWIVGALTVVGFVLMRVMLPVKGLAFVFAPVLFWGGLTGIYALRHFGFVISSQDKNVQIVAAATLGMIAALIVLIALVRLVDTLTRIRRPVTNSDARVRI